MRFYIFKCIIYSILLSLILINSKLNADNYNTSKNQSKKTLIHLDFESENSLTNWIIQKKKSVSISKDKTLCVKLSIPPGKFSDNKIYYPLPVKQIQGCTLYFEADIKAEQVKAPYKPWNGIKFMFQAKTPAQPLYIHPQKLWGTFDWKPISFMVHVPENINKADLVLGLEQTTGTVWFDNIKVTVLKRRKTHPLTSSNYMNKGHNLPRLRGVMSPNKFNEADFENLANNWNVNLIRWQLTWQKAHFGDQPELALDMKKYNKWLEDELNTLDKVVDACEKYRLMLVIDLHTPPGGRDHSQEKTMTMFLKKEYQERFVQIWREIAQRYRGRKCIWGYDILNEPNIKRPVASGLNDWQELAELTAKEIRKIDRQTAIIVETENMASPTLINMLRPINVDNIIYSIHMYTPGSFTHQGILGFSKGISYPGKIEGKLYNRKTLRQYLQPVVDFQKRYNAHIYVGEFSAIRWAPGAEQYLSDVIDIFEDYGWDWTYHAYREWHGWDLEFGSDPKNRAKVTSNKRKELLLKWFSKNVKPTFMEHK